MNDNYEARLSRIINANNPGNRFQWAKKWHSEGKKVAEVIFAKTNSVKITSEVVSWASFHEERAEKMLRYLDTAEEITLSDIRYKMASIVYRESLLLRGNGSGGS